MSGMARFITRLRLFAHMTSFRRLIRRPPIAGPHKKIQISGFLSLGIFLGLLAILMCIATATLAALKLRSAHLRRDRSLPGNGKGTLLTRPGNLPIKEKISVPLSQTDDMYDEKNPDVVPYNEGKCLMSV